MRREAAVEASAASGRWPRRQDDRAVASHVLVEAQATSFGQHTSKRGLAHFQRIAPQVVAIQFDQVEGVEEGTVVVAVVAGE